MKVEGEKAIAAAAKRLERQGKILERIARRAVNTTVRRGRVIARRRIQQQLNLKASKLNEEIDAFPARRGGRIVGRIVANRRPKLIMNFGGRELKRGGITVKVSRRGPRKKIPSAFVIPLRQGTVRGAVVRQEVARRMNIRGVDTGPSGLHVLHGPSVYQVFRRIRPALHRVLDNVLLRETDRLIRVEQEKLL